MSRQMPLYTPDSMPEDDIVSVIAKRFLAGERVGIEPKLEHWYGADYLVLRFSDEGRILFQLVSVQKKQVFIFHAITENHDYERVTRKQKFENEVTELPLGYRLLKGALDLAEMEHARLLQWHEKFISLNIQQTEKADASLEAQITFLSGPPGAGKSLAVFSALQSLVYRESDSLQAPRVLFICETPGLVHYFRHAWKEWYKAPKDTKKAVHIIFSSYADAVPGLLLSDQDFSSVIENPKETIMRYLIGKNILSEVAELMLQEWLLHSDHLYHDFISQNTFENSTYQRRVGARQHAIPADLIETAYKYYCEYMCSKKMHVNILLQPLPVVESDRFTHVFADEAHVYSLVQLQTLFNLGKQSTFVIDPHQSNAAVSNIDLFSVWLVHEKQVEPIASVLPVTYRTPPEITAFLNRILHLKNAIHGGVLSRHAYHTLLNGTTESGAIAWMKREDGSQEQVLSTYGKSIKFAVIIFDPSDRDFAKIRYGVKDFQIFLLEEIRGREFDRVAVLSPFSSDIISDINTDCRLLNISEAESLSHRPAHKELSIAESKKARYLNLLLIAGSRATELLIIDEFSKTLQQQRHAMDYFSVRQSSAVSVLLSASSQEDTPEDIIELARKYFQENDPIRAKALLRDRLNMTDLQIAQFLSVAPQEKRVSLSAALPSGDEHPSLSTKKEIEPHFFKHEGDNLCLLEKLFWKVPENNISLLNAVDHINEKNKILIYSILFEKCSLETDAHHELSLSFLIKNFVVGDDQDLIFTAFSEFVKTRAFKRNPYFLFQFPFFLKDLEDFSGITLFRIFICNIDQYHKIIFDFVKRDLFDFRRLDPLPAFFSKKNEEYVLWADRFFKNKLFLQLLALLVEKSCSVSLLPVFQFMMTPIIFSGGRGYVFNVLIQSNEGLNIYRDFLNATHNKNIDMLKNDVDIALFFKLNVDKIKIFLDYAAHYDVVFLNKMMTFFSRFPEVFSVCASNFFHECIVNPSDNPKTIDLIIFMTHFCDVQKKAFLKQQVFLCMSDNALGFLRSLQLSLEDISYIISVKDYERYFTDHSDAPISIMSLKQEKENTQLYRNACVEKMRLMPAGSSETLLALQKISEIEGNASVVDAHVLTKIEIVHALYNYAVSQKGSEFSKNMMRSFYKKMSMDEVRSEMENLGNSDQIDYFSGVPLKVDFGDLSSLFLANFDRDHGGLGSGMFAIKAAIFLKNALVAAAAPGPSQETKLALS